MNTLDELESQIKQALNDKVHLFSLFNKTRARNISLQVQVKSYECFELAQKENKFELMVWAFNLALKYRHPEALTIRDACFTRLTDNETIMEADIAETNIDNLYRHAWIAFLSSNSDQGFYWLNAAAKQGHAEAQFYLGLIYEEGRGVKQNLNTAFQWLREAAKQGHEEAQYHLGRKHKKVLDVAKDDEDAVEGYLTY